MLSNPSNLGLNRVGRWLLVLGLLLTSLNLLAFVTSVKASAAPIAAANVDDNASPALMAQTSVSHKGTATGAVSGSQIVHLAVSLKESNPEAETAYLKDLYDSHSANYHHFLTPTQYAAQFGPSQTARAQVVSYLQSKGFKLTQNGSNGSLISFEGAASNVEQTFNVHLNNYKASDGRTFFGSDKTPAYPQTLKSYVNGFVGFTDEIQPQNNLKFKTVNGKPDLAPGNMGYSPAELRNAYNVTSLINAGYDGTGQNVALVEFAGYNPSDIQGYDTTFALGSPTPQNIAVDGANPIDNQGDNGEVEATLDIETINALAPKAQVLVYVAASQYGFDSWLDEFQQIATDDKAAQISSSWGYDGDGAINTIEPSFIPANEQIMRQFALQGQSFFDASGDAGTYFSDGGANYYQLPISNYPASSPYATAVGGTSLYLNGADANATYSSETTWDSILTGATGGGLSNVFLKSQTQWQIGPGTDVGSLYNPNGARQIPDVSADADPFTGIGIYGTVADYYNGIEPEWFEVGGTSLATPEWASFAALANQYAAKNSGVKVGFANPALYNILNNPTKYASDFHDITVGTNDPYCFNEPYTNGGGPTSNTCFPPYGTAYYSSTVGYDLASGIGTPNLANLIPDLVNINPQAQILATPGVVNLGINNSFYPSSKTITLNALNSAINYNTAINYINGSNWLTISAPSGTIAANSAVSITLSLNSANLTADYYSANITVTDTANPSDYTVIEVAVDVNPSLSVDTNNVNLTVHTTSAALPTALVNVSSPLPVNVSSDVEEADTVGAIKTSVPYPNSLTVKPNSPQQIRISVYPLLNVYQTTVYTGTMYIFDTANPLDKVAVNVTITVIPDVTLSATSLNFTASEGQANPPSQNITFSLAGGAASNNVGLLGWVYLGSNWLNVEFESNATITPTLTAAATVSVNIYPPTGLPLTAGVYHGIIVVEQYNGFAFTIPVTLTITGSAYYNYGLPFVANNYNGFTNYLSLQNTNAMTATVAIEYYDVNGIFAGSDNKTIAPFGSASFQPSVVAGYAASGLIVSTQPLSLLVPEATPAGGSAYSVPSLAAAKLYDPIAINNATFQTQLTIFNAGSTASSVTVNFYNGSDGSPITGATQTFNLAPHGSKTLYQNDPNSGLTNFNGWAAITGSDGSQLTAQVLEQNTSAHFVAILSASAYAANTEYAPAVFSSYLGSFNTGMNIVNTSNTPASITVSYYNITGTLVTTQNFDNVAPNAIEGIYQPFVSGLGSSFNGSVIISSTQPIVVGVNESGGKTAAGNSESGTYLALSSGSQTVNVPVQANNAFGGYVTGGTIQNLTAQTITVTYTYRSPQGTAVGNVQTLKIAPHASAQLYQGASNQSLPNGFFGTAVATSDVPNSIAIVTNAVNSAFFYTFTSPSS